MYYGMGYYWDPTYILVLIGMIICLLASGLVNSTMNKYSKVRNMSNLTGAEAARRILNNEGLYDVQVECLPNNKGDHYDPRSKTVRLSAANYNGASVTAVAVASHECGHAIQHYEGYFPLKLRSLSVPIANIGSKLSWPIIIIGLILGMVGLARIGVFLFTFVVLFQLITLPVEFNASSRALRVLESRNLLIGEELDGAAKMLRAAALTYVAALFSSILQLLRLILLTRGNNRRR